MSFGLAAASAKAEFSRILRIPKSRRVEELMAKAKSIVKTLKNYFHRISVLALCEVQCEGEGGIFEMVPCRRCADFGAERIYS